MAEGAGDMWREPDRLTCIICHQPMAWVDCPTGGWWAHDAHPEDGHDAIPDPRASVTDTPKPEIRFTELFTKCSSEVADRCYPKGESTRRGEFLRAQALLCTYLMRALTVVGILKGDVIVGGSCYPGEMTTGNGNDNGQ